MGSEGSEYAVRFVAGLSGQLIPARAAGARMSATNSSLPGVESGVGRTTPSHRDVQPEARPVCDLSLR